MRTSYLIGSLIFLWLVAALFWLQHHQVAIAVAWLILSHITLILYYHSQYIRLRNIDWQHTQLLTATHALPDGMLLIDADFHILWANEKLIDHLELPTGLLQHRSVYDVFTHYPELIQFITAEKYHTPLAFDTPQRQRKLLIQAIPFQKKQKMLVTQDITALERLHTTRRDFVANVSHELRTPLTTILGFLETIHTADPPFTMEEQNSFLSIIHAQAHRMQSLVADLLTLFTLESSSIEKKQSINLKQLLLQLQPEMLALSNQKHHISWDLEEHLEIQGNPSEIQSAITNLMTNAIRYTPEHGSIHISWTMLENGLCRFSVEDSGPGIAEEHLERITERFYRVDKGRSREAGGTGLGLAIVKHIAIRHQAKLLISSQLGKGSNFILLFQGRKSR